MSWRKFESICDMMTYYYNDITKKEIKISWQEKMTRKARKFEKLRKIREHKRLLFQIKFFLYKETIQDKESFNFFFNPVGSDNLFNKINDIDLKKYKFGTVKSILKYIYIRDTQTIRSFMDDFFSILPPQDIKYKDDILNRPYHFVWFVSNNIKFFDKFNLIPSLTFVKIKDNKDIVELLQKNIDEYRQTGENSWREECFKDLKEEEDRKRKQKIETQQRYRQRIKDHRYFTFFQ